MSIDSPCFGIDFGTTNSSMAWFDPETKQAQLLKNAEGEEKTPSLVYFREDETLVGKPVQDKLEESEHYDEEEREDLNQRVVKGIKRNLLDPPVIPIPGRKPVRPVEVVAEILGKLKHDAESEHFDQEIKRVVITCPAIFDEQRREVLFEAAAKIGFSDVELFEEPTAAAMAFVRRGQRVGKGVLVYDLGAGTFDLSVVTRNGGDSFYVPMEPQGNPRCGGNDFDLALYHHCDEIAKEKLGQPISLTADVDMHFLDQCRSRKENLSGNKESRFSSMVFAEDGSVRFFKHKVSRQTFEDLIRTQITNTISETAKLWEQARDQGYEVDTVVMIGGSSRVPLVKRLLEEALPMEPRGFTEKDYAVALGAAYHANEVQEEKKEDVDPQLAKYQRALEICWTDRKLTHTEVEWLENLKQELELASGAVATAEREIMGDTMEEVLRSQEKTAKDRYRKVLKLGWKDKKLDVLRDIPSARLDMLLDNHELFCESDDFADCPVSATDRKLLVDGVPWPIFAMAARVATNADLTPTAVAERLRTLADELGLSKDQALDVERNVLGNSVEDFFEHQEEAARKASRDEYRKEVEKAGTTKLWVDKLGALSTRLGLDYRETDDIEKKVLGDTLAAIVAEQEAVQKLSRKHKVKLSEIKGTGKGGKVTRRDMEAYIEEQKRKKQEREEREGREKELRESHAEAQELLDEAAKQREQGLLDTALQHIQAACELAPDYAPAFFMKAELLQQKGEWRLAIAAATSCLKIEPEHLGAVQSRVICRWFMDDYAGAKEDADKLVALAPGYDSYIMRAITNFRTGNISTTISDVRSALEDSQAPEADVGPFHAATGVLLHQGLNSPEDALTSFEKALEGIPADHGEEYSQNFSSTCGIFDIEVQDPPVPAVHKWLWQACKAVHGSSRTAAETFTNHNTKRTIVEHAVWEGDPIFGLYNASVYAKQGNGASAVEWLKPLFSMHPDFDVKQVKQDRWIKGCKDATLREFLTPTFSHTESVGSFFNSLTVENTSAFRTTSLKVTVNVTRSDGKRVAPIKRELDALGAGQSHTWQEVFPDAGWFGGNINDVTVHVKCAEE